MPLFEDMRPAMAKILPVVAVCALLWVIQAAKTNHDLVSITLMPPFKLMALCMDVRDNAVCFAKYRPLLVAAVKRRYLLVSYFQLET